MINIYYSYIYTARKGIIFYECYNIKNIPGVFVMNIYFMLNVLGNDKTTNQNCIVITDKFFI